MAEIFLTQSEADYLLHIEKQCDSDDRWDFPLVGVSQEIPLTSVDGREKFLLDLSRKGVDLLKFTYQNRVRKVVILALLDYGRPHQNPDGKEVGSPHLHVYKEGYADKWAYPLTDYNMDQNASMYDLLYEFMKFCRITKPPIIDERLF